MKKILLCSFVISGILFANQLSYLPLNKSNLSNENGGEKTAIEAYSDGIGIYTAGKFEIDNRAMNELVFIHGEAASKEGKTLKEFVLDNGSNKEKDLAEKLGNIAENIMPNDGTVCDDKNNLTIEDIYINGVCLGTSIIGNSCNDNNINTYNDIINESGTCIGQLLTESLSPSPLYFTGYRTYNLSQGGSISISQHVSGSVNGTISSISNLSKPIYMEFSVSGSNIGVRVNATNYKNMDGIGFYNVSGTIGIFYNPQHNNITICSNGASCKKAILNSSTLNIFLGSGTLSSGTVSYLSNINNTYKNNAINFSNN